MSYTLLSSWPKARRELAFRIISKQTLPKCLADCIECVYESDGKLSGSDFHSRDSHPAGTAVESGRRPDLVKSGLVQS